MAFNGSGTFGRLYNWVTDKAGNVPVTASRMDAEMDGMATGLSTAICKDGQTATSARIPFAAGTSGMSGAVSGVSYAHTNDANTGMYFPAADQVALVAGGTATIAATATTATITGATTITGALTVTGAITGAVFPAGTVMLFVQTAAPTGWTKIVTSNDAALRVVSGAASTGGTAGFTTAFAARTITQGNLPNVNFTVSGTTDGPNVDHTHNTGFAIGATAYGVGAFGPPAVAGGAATGTSSVTHTHAFSGIAASGGSGTAMDFAVKYVDVIQASKDA